jgi:uncharacterized membrane protein
MRILAKVLSSVFFIILLSFIFSKSTLAKTETQKAPQTTTRVEAVVTKINTDTTIIEENGDKHPYQKLTLLGTSGIYKGKTISVENGKVDQDGIVRYKVGDKVVLSQTLDFQGKPFFTITDYVRREPLYILIAIFIILTIIIGRLRGFTSLIGMGISFGIIFLFILPQISKSYDPVTVTIIASLFIIPITFYLSHGVNQKTTLAVVGTLISLVITGVLANVFVNATHLTGFASEEAGFLDAMKNGAIDMHALLLAGIIIGLLGILDDITISQSAVVFQLKDASPKISFKELYNRAMDVGRDHIASMANTLVLVYAGAALPLLLLFVNNPAPFSEVINYEIIAEEIVRTMVASIGLIIAVPITTFLTSIYLELSLQKEKNKVEPKTK